MSQRDVPDWFSFYVYEFMSDERVVAMTLEQVGAYVLLLLGQWINGSIPADIPALARILKRTPEEMEILWAGIAPCFKPHPEEAGRLIQPRLEQERSETLSRIEKKREQMRVKRERSKSVPEQCGNVPAQNGNVPPPCTVLSLISNSSSKKGDVEKHIKQWEEFKRFYPQHRFDEERAARAWVARESEADAILAGLRLWVESEQWKERGGKFANWASRFISEGIYLIPPPSIEEAEAPSRYREWDGKS